MDAPGFSTSPESASSPSVTYAGGPSPALVLLGGAVSSALALVAVYLANRSGENVMGWYADYVLPVGAILVGAVAASGYGIASWVTGCKITGRLMAAVLAMLVGAYFAAQYVEFRLLFPDGAIDGDGNPVGFWVYFDEICRGFAWVQKNGEVGSPLGMWGYAFRALEVVGFVGGGALVPLILRGKAYCDRCQRYMTTSNLSWIGAGYKPAIHLTNRAAHKEADAQTALAAQAAAEEALQAYVAAVKASDPISLQREIEQRGPRSGRRKVGGLSCRISVDLVHCRQCADGHLLATEFTGQGKQVSSRVLWLLPADAGLVAAMARLR